MKKKIIAAAVAAAIVTPVQANDLGFESGTTTGWTSSTLSAVGSTTTQAGPNTWVINPYGSYMGRLQIQSGNFNQMTSALGLTSSSSSAITTLLQQQAQTGGGNPNPTTAGWVTREVTLTAGQTFTLAWQYVSVDYVPFNDGSIATLTQSGTSNAVVNNYNQQYALLGFTNPGTGDYSTGSYGATGWQVATFQVSQDGTYTLGFGVFNLGDTALSPVLYIDEVQGTTTKNGQPFGAVAPNNATAPSSPAATPPSPPPPPPQVSTIGSGTTEGTGNLASSVTVNGGTIQISSNNITLTNTFTVNNGGLTVDQNGNVSTFNGVISGAGGVTIANTGTGGGVTFAAVNTYTGPTTVNSGASLTNTGTIAGAVNNSGSFTNSGTAGNINNTGAVVNSGTVGIVTNNGSFANSGTTGTVSNGGTFTNTGTVSTFNNAGVLNNNAGGTINELGYNNHWVVNNGTINTVTYNGGTVNNHGTIGSINNSESHGTFHNYGTVTGNVTTNSTFNNNATGVVQGLYTNNGTLNNAGIVGAVTNDGVFNNTGTAGAVTLVSGTFTNTGTAASVDNTAGLTFTNGGTITGQLTNAGTVTNDGNVGSVNNTGTYNNAGTTGNWTNSSTMNNSGTAGNGTNSGTFNNDGTVGTISNVGTFTNNSGGTVSGLFTNDGTLINSGILSDVNNSGVFTNSGTAGNWANSGTAANAGTMGNGTNSGTLNNSGTVGTVTNTGWFANALNAITGFINNLNVFTNNGTTAAVNNSGSFTNNGTTNGVNNTGTFVNAGTAGEVHNEGNFTNTGTVGNITANTGTFINNGTAGDWNNSSAMTNTGTMGNGTNSGTLVSSGTLGNVNNSGTFTNSGNTGTVTNTGTFNYNGGTLGGYSQPSGTTVMTHGTPITVTGPAQLGGHLTINNAPTAFGRYDQLTAGSVNGTFGSFASNGVNDYLKYSDTGVKLYVTPSAVETQNSINPISGNLQNMINLQSSNLVGNLGTDCNIFGEQGSCVAVNIGASKAGTGDLFNGGLTVSKKINDEWRMGIFTSSFLNDPTVGGLSYAGNPAVGGFLTWTRDRLSVTASGGASQGSMTVNRSGPENGTGRASVDNTAYQLRGSYSIPLNDTVTIAPYAGVRYTDSRIGGYTETGPVFPLTVDSTRRSSTDLIGGVTLSKQLNDKLTGSVSAGLTHRLSGTDAQFRGTSEIGNMSNFSGPVPNNGNTNAAFGAGLNYAVDKNTRVGVNLGWMQNGSNPNLTSVGISLTKGF